MKYKQLLFLLFLFFKTGAFSQEDTPARVYSFSGYLWSSSFMEVDETGNLPELYFHDGMEERRFPLRPRALTRSYQAKGTGRILWYQRVEAEDAETGEVVIQRIPVMEGTVPLGWDGVLFVFNRKRDGTFDVVSLRQDEEFLPKDHVSVVNSGPDPVICMNGDQRFVLAAGTTMVFQPQRGNTLMEHGYRLQVAKEGRGERGVFYSRSHRLNPGSRQILLIHGGKDRLDILTLDALNQKPKEPADGGE